MAASFAAIDANQVVRRVWQKTYGQLGYSGHTCPLPDYLTSQPTGCVKSAATPKK
jgi:hypothetical protein